MSQQSNFSSLFNGSNEQSTDPNPTFLTLSPKTIRLGHGSEVFPIKNLTRIGKYKVLEKRFPLLLVIVLSIAGGVSFYSLTNEGMVFGGILLAIAAYGIWKRMQPKTFAFGFETNSGTVRYLYVKDEGFVAKIVDTVTKYIEFDQSSGVVINVEDRSISNVGYIGGNAQTGDGK